MNDWVALVLIMTGYGIAMLYAASRPAWLVVIWKQIERPMRWAERKTRRLT